MRIIFMGTPDFAAYLLKVLHDSHHEILLTVSQPDRPRGRHKDLVPSSVRKMAMDLGIRNEVTERLRKDTCLLELLKELSPDMIVVAAFGQILPKEILEIPRYGAVNIHASLLPKYRGASPIQWSIINGDSETGITTMLMDEGLDTGKILLQKKIRIENTDTGGSLFDRLSILGGETILETIRLMEEGKISPLDQDEDKATKVGLLKKEDGLIDWNMSCEEIERRVRGLFPWPGAYTFFNGKMLKILKSETSDMPSGEMIYKGRVSIRSDISENGQETQDAPGSVFQAGGMYIKCGLGYLKILSLQPESKKAMDAESFLRGVR